MMDTNVLKTEEELAFAVFCIENLARRYQKNAADIYNAMKKQGDILNNYIIPSYAFLHTQDKDYILDDIERAMKKLGVEL